MSENVHPVVRLLAKRMESHPEEFKFHSGGSLAITGRWETWISQLGWYFNEAEKELIYGKAKELIFQRVHEEVMDELLNGEERRAEKERAHQEQFSKYLAQRQQAAGQANAASLQMPITNANIHSAIGQLQNIGMQVHQDYARNELVARDLISGGETRIPIDNIYDKPTSLIGQLKKFTGIK